MELKEINAIDTMCRSFYCLPEEITRGLFEVYEFRVMAMTTFAGVLKKIGAKPGEEWKVLGLFSKGSFEIMLLKYLN